MKLLMALISHLKIKLRKYFLASRKKWPSLINLSKDGDNKKDTALFLKG
jgi:hypothetical protein